MLLNSFLFSIVPIFMTGSQHLGSQLLYPLQLTLKHTRFQVRVGSISPWSLNFIFTLHSPLKMTSLLQMKAQFKSLTNQYDDNLAEIAACAARNDEGMLSFIPSAAFANHFCKVPYSYTNCCLFHESLLVCSILRSSRYFRLPHPLLHNLLHFILMTSLYCILVVPSNSPNIPQLTLCRILFLDNLFYSFSGPS